MLSIYMIPQPLKHIKFFHLKKAIHFTLQPPSYMTLGIGGFLKHIKLAFPIGFTYAASCYIMYSWDQFGLHLEE